MLTLEGRVAVVTGLPGASAHRSRRRWLGQGRGWPRSTSSPSGHGSARDQPADVVSTANEVGAGAMAIHGDVRLSSDMRAAVDRVVEAWGDAS
jgi:hypothetical protein